MYLAESSASRSYTGNQLRFQDAYLNGEVGENGREGRGVARPVAGLVGGMWSCLELPAQGGGNESIRGAGVALRSEFAWPVDALGGGVGPCLTTFAHEEDGGTLTAPCGLETAPFGPARKGAAAVVTTVELRASCGACCRFAGVASVAVGCVS